VKLEPIDDERARRRRGRERPRLHAGERERPSQGHRPFDRTTLFTIRAPASSSICSMWITLRRWKRPKAMGTRSMAR
jgi:hypothetical protein